MILKITYALTVFFFSCFYFLEVDENKEEQIISWPELNGDQWFSYREILNTAPTTSNSCSWLLEDDDFIVADGLTELMNTMTISNA